MRVLYCITRSDTVGGAHVHVADLAAWLRNAGHDAVVVVGGVGPYCRELDARDVPFQVSRHLCRAVRPVEDVAAVFELRRMFRELQPDLISLHSAKAGLIGRFAAIGLGVPVIFTAHGWSFTEGISSRTAAVYRCIERLAAPLAQRIITVSRFDRALALRSGVGRPEQLITIHNAMPDNARMAAVAESGVTVRIAMVARLDAQKDHLTLFRALAHLRDRDWTLDLVGDGPMEGAVRQQAFEAGIADRVRFLGLRRDVGAILAASHVFVLSSHWEGFPRSILEAMRGGLPVVATDVGGVSESVQDGVTGYLVPRKDEDLLAARQRRLLDSPEVRVQLGRRARQQFEREYRFERMALETVGVYEEVLHRESICGHS